MTKDKSWTVIELLKTTTEFFKQKLIENPRLNAEILLAHVLNKSRISLYVEFERPVSPAELNKFREYVSRRSKSEPLQYITGQTEFMGLPFEVNPSVLIPRPETEVLCEEILKLKGSSTENMRIMDIGTGSGCIAISLAHFWKEAQLTGIDINPQALDTAKKNMLRNNISNLSLIEQDVFNITSNKLFSEKYNIIVSNPPYIAKDEMNTLPDEVKNFEPHKALTDFDDGLNFYKHIMDLIVNDKLQSDYLFFEMSGSQPKKIVAEAKKRNFKEINVINDLSGLDRVLKIQL